MADRSKRDALRGVEVDTIVAIFEVLAPEQWAELLTTPLKRASATGNRDLAEKLVGQD